ncbi:MAG: hypothetical protein C7N36_21480, partial [Bacteroidetes bacterium]
MKHFRSIFTLLLLLGLGSLVLPLCGQTDTDFFAQLEEDEQAAVEALVLYPADTRLAILEVCQYPEAIIKLQRIQDGSSTDFQALVDPLPRSTQEMIWDLTRYPGLIHQLATAPRSDERRVQQILKTYPEVIHERALTAYRGSPRLLQQTDELQQAADNAFQQVLSEYDPALQDNLRALLQLPEVLDLLTKNIQLTILVGDRYRKFPDRVLEQADSLNLVVARENAQELEDWKQQIANDPAAEKDLQAAAQNYAAEYGYDDVYYNPDNDNRAGDDMYYDTTPRRVEVYYEYSYPFWFGYPTWYGYPCWRPYPFWYHWGFSFWTGPRIVIVRLPSFYFTTWYFNRPEHHIWWPGLSGHFVNHYAYHPRYRSGIVTGVARWRQNNREVITDEWIREVRNQPRHFKEYGEFEYNRERYNQRNPAQKLSPRQFLDENPRAYPELAKTQTQREATVRERTQAPATTQPDRPAPTTQPRTRTQPEKPGQVNPQPDRPGQPRTQPEQPGRVNPQPDRPTPEKPGQPRTQPESTVP